MFNSKKNNVLIAIVLIGATFNAHGMMERRSSDSEKERRGNMSGEGTFGFNRSHDINLVRDILLGNIKINSEEQILVAFINFPMHEAKKIAYLLWNNSCTQSIRVAGQTINTLAQEVNNALNDLINDPVFCLQLIKYLAKKFNYSDETVAMALQTDEAKHRLRIQQMFEPLFSKHQFNQVKIDNLYTEYKTYVDLNFTYKGKANTDLSESLLLSVAHNDTTGSKLDKIKWLLNHSADINSADVAGRTVLMICSLDTDTNIVQFLCQQPTIHINQQDNEGNTALTLVCMTRISVSRYDPIIRILLDAGADPKITNNIGMTPLKEAQKNENIEAFRLMQEAINKKQSKK